MTRPYDILFKEFKATRMRQNAEPIMNLVLEYFECHPDAIKVHKRNRELVFVRAVLWYILRKHTGMPYMDLGYMIDHEQPFDHATVLHAVRNTEQNISIVNGRVVDKVTAKVVEEIEQLLTEKNLLIKDAAQSYSCT